MQHREREGECPEMGGKWIYTSTVIRNRLLFIYNMRRRDSPRDRGN